MLHLPPRPVQVESASVCIAPSTGTFPPLVNGGWNSPILMEDDGGFEIDELPIYHMNKKYPPVN